MPDGMSSDMPDRMRPDKVPECLPVTKRINVMVGITRSIIILDLDLFFVDLTTILIILCETVTGYVYFGPAHPPVGPGPAAGSAAPIPCDTLGFPSPFPICPLLLNFYFHFFSGLSVTQGLNLVSTWVKVPHFRGIHLASISKLSTPCASNQTS